MPQRQPVVMRMIGAVLRSSQHTLHPKLQRLLPLPFRRGEGWGEGLLRVVYPAVLATCPERIFHLGMPEEAVILAHVIGMPVTCLPFVLLVEATGSTTI